MYCSSPRLSFLDKECTLLFGSAISVVGLGSIHCTDQLTKQPYRYRIGNRRNEN
uniref:Uncharacterized protein n=1 Tax=Arundo donax TaxID=35708 RepID=A0A0A8YMQ2_ARUDO